MTATQSDLADLSRYIFRAPKWYASVIFALLIAAVTGVGAFDSQYVLQDAWEGVFFIGLPTVAASVFTTPVDRRLGGQLTYNRASLLALTCEVLVVVVLTVAGSVAAFTAFDQQFVFDALIVSLASVFALRLLVVMAVSRTSFLVATVPAGIQTGAAAVLFFIYSETVRILELGGPLVQNLLSRPEQAPSEISSVVRPRDFILLAAVSGLYAVAVYGFLVVLDRPWRRSLGVSMLDFLRGFIGHVAEGTRELEDFFEQIGEDAVVPVTVLAFRHADDGSEKARFVLPMIHPGPMGEIGGGNLPNRVATEADGLAFPPHATAGHDFNLVTEREVDAIIDTAAEAYDRIEYSDAATQSVRTQSGDAKMLGQSFGGDALLVATYSPAFADDVEYAVGLSAAAEARSNGLDDVMLVDAHNCNNGLQGEDLGHVYPGSERSFQMIQAARAAATELADADVGRPHLGVAWDETDWGPLDGIGPLGIRAAVLEVADQRTAYVLVDGNNMEPGLRDRIVDAIQATAAIDAVEVMTTDTHVVNQVEASNQVGEAIDDDELVALVEDLVEAAAADLEPVEAGMASERADVTVFGNDRTETLASHANAVIAMGAALAGAVILAVTAISVLIFFLAAPT
jgi:putative membrane protein